MTGRSLWIYNTLWGKHRVYEAIIQEPAILGTKVGSLCQAHLLFHPHSTCPRCRLCSHTSSTPEIFLEVFQSESPEMIMFYVFLIPCYYYVYFPLNLLVQILTMRTSEKTSLGNLSMGGERRYRCEEVTLTMVSLHLGADMHMRRRQDDVMCSQKMMG